MDKNKSSFFFSYLADRKFIDTGNQIMNKNKTTFFLIKKLLKANSFIINHE